MVGSGSPLLQRVRGDLKEGSFKNPPHPPLQKEDFQRPSRQAGNFRPLVLI
jgi:hypothetical protein